MVGGTRAALSTNGGPVVVTRVTRLSKSRYISGDQSHLKLWYDTYARDLAAELDDTLKAEFATGHEVGEMDCRRRACGRVDWLGGCVG